MDFPNLIKDPEKASRSLIRKLTHSGETELDKDLLRELKAICKANDDSFMVVVQKECMKYLHKEHSQVRVSTIKLIDYLFQKSHTFRDKLLEDFNVFMQLTLAISQSTKMKIQLPPPKKYADLLKELAAKIIHSWYSDYGCGYEKIRYAHRYLQEHHLVDFGSFQVRTREDLIRQQKMLERQERILTLNIDNRIKEYRELRPEIEQILAQIESLIELLVPNSQNYIELDEASDQADIPDEIHQHQHGIANLSQRIEVEFSPYMKVQSDQGNKDIVIHLKELKKQLVENKLTKLVTIEKTLCKKSEEFIGTLKDIIDLKSKSMNLVLKLCELKIVDKLEDEEQVGKPLDKAGSSDEESDFEEVAPKEDLETYIPKSMRFEYGLESIDPKELAPNKISLTDESFSSNEPVAGCSKSVLTCNVKMDSGKLCPRQDKFKCPFHGRIIPRDHLGVPLDEEERLKEEMKLKNDRTVPEWQDPQLLRDIEAATGVDLTMPSRKKHKLTKEKKLANTKTCDLTPKKRLQRRLKLLKT